jgi:hypothetical protein
MNLHPVQLIDPGFYHKGKVTLPSEYFLSILENLNNVSVLQSKIFLVMQDTVHKHILN